MNIEKIHLQGFKSAADVILHDASPFSIFAGPNGSGKSNLADGLAFFGSIIQMGSVSQAVRVSGGYGQIHCFKHRGNNAKTAKLELVITLDGHTYDYSIKVYQMDSSPQLEEYLKRDGQFILKRNRGGNLELQISEEQELQKVPNVPDDMPALIFTKGIFPIYSLMTNIRVFRFDPLEAKQPDKSAADATELDIHGRNIATMLSVLQKDDDFREQVLEWIGLLVPGLEKVIAKSQQLDGQTVIKFKETGLKAYFPANLISDGTIYALCIMTAVLSRESGLGITFIEEPERGIHPQAISELVLLMREHANQEHPVFVTTHSESIVRSGKLEELWLVNKKDGKTQIKRAGKSDSLSLGDLNLDKAWLMNFFDGGLPW